MGVRKWRIRTVGKVRGDGVQNRGGGIYFAQEREYPMTTLPSRGKAFPSQEDFPVASGKLAWGKDHLKFNIKVYLN